MLSKVIRLHERHQEVRPHNPPKDEDIQLLEKMRTEKALEEEASRPI